MGDLGIEVLKIPARVSSLAAVQHFAEELLPPDAKAGEECVMYQLAVEELFINIVSYAYEDDGGDIEVSRSFDTKNKTVCLIFDDEGVPFNPLERDLPDTSLPVEDRDVGGLGIYLARQCVDELSYSYVNGHNRLSLKKVFR